MTTYVYTVTRTDFDGPEDEDGESSHIGHYRNEEQADEAAGEIFDEYSGCGYARDGDCLRDKFFDTPIVQVTVEAEEMTEDMKLEPPPTPLQWNGRTDHTVYIVTRTDYKSHDDKNGQLSIVDVYDEEEEADKAAEYELYLEEGEGVFRDENYVRDSTTKAPKVYVTTELQFVVKKDPMPPARKVVAPATPAPAPASAPAPAATHSSRNKYGSMISMPIGKVQGLRRAKCMRSPLLRRGLKS